MNLSKYKFVDDSKELIIKILSLINYDGDKDFFSEEFSNLISARTVDGLLNSMTEDRKNYFVSKLNTPEANLSLAQEFIDQITEAKFKEEYIKFFKSTINDMLPTLTNDESLSAQINTIKDSLA